jgi:diguanylate cyclase (GGDEF)-like protein
MKVQLKGVVDKMVTWYRDRTRAYVDLAVIAAAVVPLYLFLIHINAFDLTYAWSRQHEDWQADELISLAFCLGLAAIIFSWRRLADLRGEISQRQDAEREANRLARHDLLTGLPNRRHFLEDFAICSGRLAEGEVCAMLVVDLDHFKPINDLYGHRLGDEVLRVVASRLSELVEDEGMVARLGGDEFGILMRTGKDDDKTIRLARRIVYEIARPIPLAALSIEVGVSVGVAVYDPDASDGNEMAKRDGSQVETALRQADMAMYRAKTEGRGLYRFFDRDMDERLRQRVQLEREIKGAIANGEIVPYYQPLVDLATQTTIGYEMLARWRHPTMGVLAPAVFIPIAEDTGSIGDLTYALLTQAVKDAKDWPSHLFLSMNLSPRQFADPWLSQRLLAILTAASFPPQRLEIEITETAVVQRLQEAKVALQSLRNLGVRIALDDFGTGYSGLHHLRELHFDTIKIDRSFVSDMLQNPEDAKLVEAIVGLGHALGLQTTAEGIETEEVLDRLTELGCEVGQGFLFGRPEPVPAGALDHDLHRARQMANKK